MRAVLLAIAILLAAAAPAQAKKTEIGVADDRILMPGGPAADRLVAEWAANGVDSVRIFAHWGRIAPARKPRNANAVDYQWFYLDNAVDRVTQAGMDVTLTITGPGPAWTSSKPGRKQPQFRPKPSLYAAFAQAVASRYASRVDRYILWNEPNISAWLAPQARCKRGRCTPVSPHVYRSLVRAAYPRIADSDPVARIVVGAVSPRGQRLRASNTVMRPLLFLRRFGCRDDAFRRIRSNECRRFKPAKADGFAIHPYSGRIRPERAHPNPDDVGLAQIGNLTATLDRLQRAKAIRATTRRLGIYIDEYGYQTLPPDPVTGIGLKKQDAFLQRAAYLAWRMPRVKLFTQYLWRDEPRDRHGTWSGWQSGLRFANGRAKPSLAHFDTPFALDATRRTLWGQVRPGGTHLVTIESRRGKGRWTTLATTTTDGRGYWTVTRPLNARTSYRYRADGRVSATLRP